MRHLLLYSWYVGLVHLDTHNIVGFAITDDKELTVVEEFVGRGVFYEKIIYCG